MPLAIVFVRVGLIGVICWKLTPLPIVLSDSKIDKKRVPFSVWLLQEPIDKKEYRFSCIANKCNRSLMPPLFRLCRRIFIYRKAFIKPIFDILNRLLNRLKKGHKIKASPFGDEHWKRYPFFREKVRLFYIFKKLRIRWKRVCFLVFHIEKKELKR